MRDKEQDQIPQPVPTSRSIRTIHWFINVYYKIPLDVPHRANALGLVAYQAGQASGYRVCSELLAPQTELTNL